MECQAGVPAAHRTRSTEDIVHNRAGNQNDDRPVPARDRGFSFVEVVVTIVLMGLVVLPILAAVRGSIRASTVSRDAAEVETVLVNAVDRVNRAPRECDLTAYVEAAVESHGWEASAADVEHRYLNSSGAWQTDPSGTACPGGAFQNGIVQRIDITITSPENEISRTLEVVKSDD